MPLSSRNLGRLLQLHHTFRNSMMCGHRCDWVECNLDRVKLLQLKQLESIYDYQVLSYSTLFIARVVKWKSLVSKLCSRCCLVGCHLPRGHVLVCIFGIAACMYIRYVYVRQYIRDYLGFAMCVDPGLVTDPGFTFSPSDSAELLFFLRYS
jgi:hypothetical protein